MIEWIGDFLVMKKILLIILMVIIAGGFLMYRTKIFKRDKKIPENTNQEMDVVEEIEEEEIIEEKPKVIELPKEFDIDVPFTPQAPFAIWDETHNDACEETALLMVHKFWVQEPLNQKIAEKEILELVDFQNKNYGDFKNTDAQETAQLIKDFYGYKKVEVSYDITLDDIKRELTQGRPVIVPAAGRLLKNPNFKTPGPLYHNLVVKGYSGERIITNDPGTRLGADYVYDQNILVEAIHDWNDGDIYNGRKVMIVVYPN